MRFSSFITCITAIAPALTMADITMNYAPPQASKFVEISPNDEGELVGTASDEAMAYRALLQKDYGGAVSQFYALVKQRGQEPNLLYGLALAYQKSGNKPAAINVWNHLLANPNLDAAMKAYAHLNLAILQPTNPTTLQDIANNTVQTAETSAVYATMGQVLLNQGNQSQGLRSLELAYQNEPQNVLYAYNLAVAYDQAGDSQRALPLYTAVAESQGVATKLSTNSLNLLRKRIAYLKR